MVLGVNMGEEEFIKTLRGATNCTLKEGYEKVIFYCKTNGYDLKKKCKLLKNIFTEQQIKILTGE